jgi:hypothetical protein
MKSSPIPTVFSLHSSLVTEHISFGACIQIRINLSAILRSRQLPTGLHSYWTWGAGILSMPSGMVPIGWLGLSILFIVAGTCIVTCRYLVECQFAVPGKIMKTYEEIGEAAFPRYCRPIVAIVHLIHVTTPV